MSRQVDLVIMNARLLLESGIVHGGLGVTDGKIVLIATDEHLPRADKTIDAGGKIVMPGLIDAHAHIYDPEMPQHEDFVSGSRAAAAGGVTTFADMPLVSHVMSTQSVNEKRTRGEKDSVVDFTINAGMIDPSNIHVIPLLIQEGVAAIKAFTCRPFEANNGVLVLALSEVSEHGGHVIVHSEDQGVLDEFAKDFEGEWDAPVSHALSRPELAEYLAVSQMIRIADQTKGHLHIAHITTKKAVSEVEKAKLSGILVTTEVCPHHLMFHRDEMNRLGPKSKMNPPLRSKHDRAALWSALLRGYIDITVSDHAPCPIEKKTVGEGDIRKAWSGVDGIQTILRVLLSEGINKGRLTYHRLLEVASKNPARLLGLYPKKGCIGIGADADLVIIDPKREEKITSDMMFSKCGWTIYEGMRMKGAPVQTLVRGVSVFEAGEIQINPPLGKFQKMGGGFLLGEN